MLLGEILIQKKLIKKDQLQTALDEQKKTQEFLGMVLVRKKFIAEEDLMKTLSEVFRIPYVRLKLEEIDWVVAMRFSASLVLDNRCVPVRQDEQGWTVAITNPLDAEVISRIEEEAGQTVNLVLVSSADMDAALRGYREQVALKIKKLLDG